jgi:hypothetical protein
VGENHLLGVAQAKQLQHGCQAGVVGQHVLHAESVHADGRSRVHQLAQVAKVLAVAAVPDDEPLRRDTSFAEERQLVSTVLRRSVRVGRDRHAGV